MNNRRIAWAITGAGHELKECVHNLVQRSNVDLFLSRAAEEVLNNYHLDSQIQEADIQVFRDVQASAPVVSKFYKDVYKALVIAPATSNSMAKFICGISDTLITNLFAHAGKSKVPIIVLPTDVSAQIHSSGPHGESIEVYPRPVDLDNVKRLRLFPGVRVVDSCEELMKVLSSLCTNE
jgi:dihydromethanopterin reductase (acceptor)